ncbi:DUF2177 family protein [Fertoebacter nigrum]|uniref:DUF2177 family protein n=1 Tax=Fertoeibacter niger TaxID=2656921 RepID=A0A8X8H6L8_9RHOB|nr:DUF2177 family protein [Fertoeibacter niger]NUB44131.1 DUF2177 family protein [Fertoeibacter niger]
MAIAVLFLATSLVFLVADAIMLRSVIQPLFQTHLKTQLLDGLRLGPAALFYLTYMFGIMWFAGLPALREGNPTAALINGAVLGFVAYGTYELTSWTVMRDWHPSMVAVDWAWGTAITGIAAWAGVLAARAVA